jgi:hypothetical protein
MHSIIHTEHIKAKAYQLDYNRYRFTRDRQELAQIAYNLKLDAVMCSGITGALIKPTIGHIEEIWLTRSPSPYVLTTLYTRFL